MNNSLKVKRPPSPRLRDRNRSGAATARPSSPRRGDCVSIATGAPPFPVTSSKAGRKSALMRLPSGRLLRPFYEVEIPPRVDR